MKTKKWGRLMGLTKRMSIDIRVDEYKKLQQYSLEHKEYMTDIVTTAVRKHLQQL